MDFSEYEFSAVGILSQLDDALLLKVLAYFKESVKYLTENGGVDRIDHAALQYAKEAYDLVYGLDEEE